MEKFANKTNKKESIIFKLPKMRHNREAKQLL